MEDSFLYSHIANGTWFEIKCCYCDTDAPICLTHRKSRYASEIDYKPKSRLKFVTNFIKDHYKDIQYKLDREKGHNECWGIWTGRVKLQIVPYLGKILILINHLN